MPRSKPSKPLYQRGPYELHRREGRTNLEILWYDTDAQRQRSRSTGCADVGQAKTELDKLYLERESGQAVCPTCHRPWDEKRRFLLVQSMIDYDTEKRDLPSYPAIHASLGHVHAYLAEKNLTGVSTDEITPKWIADFEKWALKVPVVGPSGKLRARAPATVNNSVLYLAAAINASKGRQDILHEAAFKPRKPKDVNRTPTYRGDIDALAAMFAYALEYPLKRRSLLNFLRISVVTLIRPQHAHFIDVSPEAGMWDSAHRTLNLLPPYAEQTKKRRTVVPVARQAVDWLDSESGQLVPIASIAPTWTRMQMKLGLPGRGQSGPKLVRRSMAKLVRERIDRRDQPELEMFLGHRASSETTDLYAPFDPEYLSRARAAIESVIDDLESRVKNAFHRNDTADAGKVVSIIAGKS